MKLFGREVRGDWVTADLVRPSNIRLFSVPWKRLSLSLTSGKFGRAFGRALGLEPAHTRLP